jgi:NADPH:quinone reductase-like Zn-dependent oxidoreductase
MGNDSLPDQQRAWVNIGRGTPAQALVLKSDWPVPKNLRPGEVLVKVHAAALNPVWVSFGTHYSVLSHSNTGDTSYSSICRMS